MRYGFAADARGWCGFPRRQTAPGNVATDAECLRAASRSGGIVTDHVQPVEQVFAEPAALPMSSASVGGRDDAHVDLDRLAAADRLDLAFLQHPQQFHLRCRGSSPTSSRNIVPPLASTNLPIWRSVAPVKAPFS